MIRVLVALDVLHWICERVKIEADELTYKFSKYRLWESGEVQPIIKTERWLSYPGTASKTFLLFGGSVSIITSLEMLRNKRAQFLLVALL